MKKQYFKPTMEVYVVDKPIILAGSFTEGEGGGVGSIDNPTPPEGAL